MKKTVDSTTGKSRREFIQMLGVAAIIAPWLWPLATSAAQEDAKSLIKKLAGGAKLQKGKIKVKVPEVADNGARVQVKVSAKSAMTAADHVKKIHIISGGNPFPEVVSFTLGPDAGKAEVSFYMRMAKTQNVYALAEMSDGSFQMGKGKSNVTAGGCN